MSDSANNAALIEEYDAQIANLTWKKNRLIEERTGLMRKNDENIECYNSTIKAKEELQRTLDNIADYARTNRQKIDSRVKILRRMYESMERSTTQSKMQCQLDDLSQSMSSLRRAVDATDERIDYLSSRIAEIEREIERIRRQRGAILYG